MIEILTSDAILPILVQMPFVAVMGIIMLGMRQDLKDLRGDLRECIKRQGDLLEMLIKRDQ